VSAIVGQTRLKLSVKGVAGHAGTIPMRLRHDALAGAAEMVLLAEKIAGDFANEQMVATVGIVEARPGAANIVPGEVHFTLDLRTASDKAREAAIERFKSEAQAIAERRKLAFSSELIHSIATTPAAQAIQDQLGAAVSAVGATPLSLASGAGHDGLMMSKLCPYGMLFVRCREGISHNPAEYASPADMGIAIAALVRFVQRFQPPPR
jgi:allantoate deiminase